MSKKWPIINKSDPHMTVDYLLHQREYNLPFSMPIKTLSLHIYLPFFTWASLCLRYAAPWTIRC